MADNKHKTFGITNLSVANRKTVYLIIVLLLLGGVGAYSSMPKENFPELQIPEIYVGIAYPGASPKFINDKITSSIEKEINSLKNVDEINSTSIHGYATIRAKFDFKVSSSEALRRVKDAVDEARAKKDFPKDLPVEPNIFEMDISDMPILNVNLSGNYTTFQLDKMAQRLESVLEDLPQVNEVNIRGVQEQEMRIDVDPIRMNAMDVSFGDIESAISQENINLSGGELLDGNKRRTIKIEGEYEDAKQIMQTVVKQEDGNRVYMRDVANVTFADGEVTSYAREYFSPVVMLDVKKRSGENLLEAADTILSIVAKAKELGYIAEDVNVSITNDQSDQTREMVSNLENSIIFGMLLVILVLLFFLGVKNALFVGIAIPLSMFMSFIILDAMGVTLNTMVLFSLVLALGMLVDNGIVVIENIYRHRSDGLSAIEAAKIGVGEVAWPIIASTATTLAAFIPLALWPGIMGEFMKYLPITLMIVLGSSLFVALVINPVVSVVFDSIQGSKKVFYIAVGSLLLFGGLMLAAGSISGGNLFLAIGLIMLINKFVFSPIAEKFQNSFLPWLEGVYRRLLTKAVTKKGQVIYLSGTFLLLFIAFGSMSVFPPDVEFFPANEPMYVNVFIEHPIGTDIEQTNKTAEKAEEIINSYLDSARAFPNKKNDTLVYKDIVESFISQVGEGTSDPAQGVSLGATPHKARITVSFVEYKNRHDINTSDVMEGIRQSLEGKFTADIVISVAKNQNGPPMKPPVNIEVSGQVGYEDLIAQAQDLKNFLVAKNNPGVEKLKLNVESNKPELPIEIDREKARSFGTSTGQVASSIRTALFGKDVSTYKYDDETYDITIRFDESYRQDLDALLDQKMIFRNNKGQLMRIPIRSVIKEPKYKSTYSAVVRKDLLPLVTVFSQVKEGAIANNVVTELKKDLEEYKNSGRMRSDIKAKFTGQQEDQAKEMAFLSKALLIAVFLILLIVVTQFNSFSAPSVILFAVVFSLIGVLFGLQLSGMTFVVIMTMIGIISLAGVVVNNAIVLIDYTNLLIAQRREELNIGDEEKLPYEEVIDCIIRSGETRLRPVLLTAITTVLGLIPLAMGFNFDFFSFFATYDPNIYIGGDNTIFFGPMSWTIVFGLTFATFLTLVIVPVMYTLFYRVRRRIYKKAPL